MTPRTPTYMADFETTIEMQYKIDGYTRVWAWAIEEVDQRQLIYKGEEIEDFVRFFRGKTANIYFHNLKFDGSFLLDFWMSKGVPLVTEKETIESEYITTLIDGHGSFYLIEYHNKNNNTHLKFKDLMKKYRMPLEKVAEIFNIPGKSPLPLRYRPPGCEVTGEEWERVLNDVRIGAVALRFQLTEGLTGLTVASDAMRSYKDFIGKKEYQGRHPDLDYELDQALRPSYRGGWTYLNPIYKEKTLKNVAVYDINSMYPAVMAGMHEERLPKGMPRHLGYEYECKDHEVEIVRVNCNFKLKKGALPWIHYKNVAGHTSEEYIYNEVRILSMVFSTPDLDLLRRTYDTPFFEVVDKFVFRSEIGQFKEFVDKQNAVKVQATKDKNPGRRQMAKDNMNTTSGKFALNPDAESKLPRFDFIKNKIVYDRVEERRKNLYCPTSIFITAHSRNRIVTDAMRFGSQFVYADTDSLHILKGKIKPDDVLEIDDTDLGKYALETVFDRAKYLRAKAYIHEQGEGVDYMREIKCGGMPDKVKEKVTFENFNMSAIFPGKLIGKVVPGGYILSECEYKIKPKEGWR